MKDRALHIFRAGSEDWEADTCEPLKEAASQGSLLYRAYGHGPYPGDKFPKDILQEIKNIGFWDCKKEQNWGLDWHRNEGIEFTFVFNGSVTLETTDSSKKLNTGQLAITPPWIKHKVGSPHIGPSKLFWVILDVQVRRPNEAWIWPEWLLLSPHELSLLEDLIHNHERAISVDLSLLHSLERLQTLVSDEKTPEKASQVKVAINQFLIDLLEQDKAEPNSECYSTSESHASQTVNIFLQELPNYLHIPWTVDKMAYECGMGKTVFTQMIKQKTNKTPMQHLNDMRLRTASEKLTSEHSPLVKDLAEELGYSTTEYFCKCFRKKFGTSPSSYTKRAAP